MITPDGLSSNNSFHRALHVSPGRLRRSVALGRAGELRIR